MELYLNVVQYSPNYTCTCPHTEHQPSFLACFFSSPKITHVPISLTVSPKQACLLPRLSSSSFFSNAERRLSKKMVFLITGHTRKPHSPLHLSAPSPSHFRIPATLATDPPEPSPSSARPVL